VIYQDLPYLVRIANEIERGLKLWKNEDDEKKGSNSVAK
jgi:hypothetical protein